MNIEFYLKVIFLFWLSAGLKLWFLPVLSKTCSKPDRSELMAFFHFLMATHKLYASDLHAAVIFQNGGGVVKSIGGGGVSA